MRRRDIGERDRGKRERKGDYRRLNGRNYIISRRGRFLKIYATIYVNIEIYL